MRIISLLRDSELYGSKALIYFADSLVGLARCLVSKAQAEMGPKFHILVLGRPGSPTVN